jgi:antitoxin MazE
MRRSNCSAHRRRLTRECDVVRLARSGSAVCDTAGPDSDVDLLVAFDARTPLQRYGDVQFFVEDLLDGHVAVVMEKALRPEVRSWIESEVIDVCSRSSHRSTWLPIDSRASMYIQCNHGWLFGCMAQDGKGIRMRTVLKTRIVRIGNSQGVRIPKLFLEHSQLGEEVELELQANQIVIRPARRPREGWEQAFQTMAEQHDDQLLDGDVLTTTAWDEDEWVW